MCAVAAAAAATSGFAQELSAPAAQALAQGDDFALRKQYPEAMDAYRLADALSNHTCADCYLRMAYMDRLFGNLAAAVDDADRAAKTAGNDRMLAAQARLTRGLLLVDMAGGPNDPKLQQAEQEFHQALALEPKKTVAHFNLGNLLLTEGRDAEGIAELNAYISAPLANPSYVARARRLIEDPSRARVPVADDFAFTTIEGEKISKAGLRGKVALLDFWGTWCPPCRESVPVLQDIHRKFAGPAFQLVGISSDDNEETWRSFIRSHHMNWSEYIDLDGQVLALFEVHSFPTYIVLDRRGRIQFRQSGLGPDTREVLAKAIKKALDQPYTPETDVASAAPKPTMPSPAMPAVALAMDPARAQRFSSLVPLNAGLAAAGNSSAANKLIYPPEDVENGDADGNVFRNEFLGLRYEFPQSWHPATPEILEQLNHATLRFLKGSDAGNSSATGVFPQIIFQAAPDARHQVPSVRIVVERLDSLTLDSVRHDAAELELTRGATALSPPRDLVIANRHFFRTDYELPHTSPPAWVASFETLVARNYRVTLEILAGSKLELDRLAASAQSLVISK